MVGVMSELVMLDAVLTTPLYRAFSHGWYRAPSQVVNPLKLFVAFVTVASSILLTVVPSYVYNPSGFATNTMDWLSQMSEIVVSEAPIGIAALQSATKLYRLAPSALQSKTPPNVPPLIAQSDLTAQSLNVVVRLAPSHVY